MDDNGYLVIACASDDDKLLVNDHFGEAKSYKIYKISKNDIEYIDKIQNTSRRESHEGLGHGDAEKAGDIKSLLKRRDVDCILGHKIGKNIIRMRRHFIPIVSRNRVIDKSIKEVQSRFDEIAALKNSEKHMVIY